MRLHVLAGCRELLQPDVLPPEPAANLIGPQVRVATAFWLSSKCGKRYHTFLQDEAGDDRAKVMGLALKDEFGRRFEPLLIFPELLDAVEPKKERPLSSLAAGFRSQLDVLVEILAHCAPGQLQLYGLALPATVDPDGSWAKPAGLLAPIVRDRLDRLRSAKLVETAADEIETNVIEITPDLPMFGIVYRNAVSHQIAQQLIPRLCEQGWSSDAELLATAVGGILADRSVKGVFPDLPLRAEHLDKMTETIYEKCL